MPSIKHRINLTVPEEVYTRIKAYMAENGLLNEATACLQLVVQQLTAHENSKAIMNVMRNMTQEQLQTIASEGIVTVKSDINQ